MTQRERLAYKDQSAKAEKIRNSEFMIEIARICNCKPHEISSVQPVIKNGEIVSYHVEFHNN